MASHRRPLSVLATGTDEELVAGAGRVAPGLHRPDRRAERAAGDAGRRRYPDPRAVGAGAALPVRRARRHPRSAPCSNGCATSAASPSISPVSTSSRTPTCAASKRGSTDRPDVVEVIEAIEAGEASEAELPSGDELASEIERFLRDQSS